MTPVAAVVRGVLAGAAGTVAMDLVWYARYRRGGGTDGPLQWEFGGAEDWNKVSAPGQVGKRLVEGFTQRELSPHWAPLTQNVVHWAYGLFWGSLYGIIAGSLRSPRIAYGLPFGAAVWLSDYVVLPLARLYKPLWAYDAKTLAKDLSAHFAFGAGTAGTFRALSQR